jgi:hypothetical protein
LVVSYVLNGDEQAAVILISLNRLVLANWIVLRECLDSLVLNCLSLSNHISTCETVWRTYENSSWHIHNVYSLFLS